MLSAFSFVYFLLVWGLLLPFTSALPRIPLALRKRVTVSSLIPIPPSQDPFYTAPPGYESAEPGEILRVRVAPGNLSSVIGSNFSSAYNILYRTTNSRYKPSWAVTTLFVPISSSSNGTGPGSALLSYQFPYDSTDIDAGPSYRLYVDAPYWWTDIGQALGRGWYVSLPDYEGPTASFTAGVQSGHATLDSVRASLSSSFGLASDARLALWGYSGGSLASEWAAELQVQYAPELNFSGAALGGLVPNVTSLLDAVNGQLYAGLIPQGLLGITNQYPDAYNYLVGQLNPSGPYNRSTFLSTMTMDSVTGDAFFQYQDIWNYFVNGKASIEVPVVQHVFDIEGFMGYHGVPQMPLFMYKAIAEEIAPIVDTDELVDRYCAVGVNILYQRNTIGGHLAELTNGDGSAFEWLTSVLDGTYSIKYPTEGCTIQNVTVGMDTSPI